MNALEDFFPTLPWARFATQPKEIHEGVKGVGWDTSKQALLRNGPWQGSDGIDFYMLPVPGVGLSKQNAHLNILK